MSSFLHTRSGLRPALAGWIAVTLVVGAWPATLLGQGSADSLVLPPRPATLSPAVERFVAVDAPVVVITDVVLFDGTGRPAREGVTILIEGSRIAAVGSATEVTIPSDAEVIDGSGHTVTPGWVMLHEHMFYPSGGRRYNTNEVSFPPLYLGGGATTIRTGGSMDPYTDLRIAEDVAAGRIPGPRMDVTGPYLEGGGGFVRALPQLRTPEDARAHVDFWADRGVTSFKAYNLIDRATLGAAIDAAHARGLEVTAHLCSITYQEAADLGIDNLEHGFRAATDWVEGKEPDVCPSGGARSRSYAELDLESPAFLDVVDHLIEAEVTITTTPTVFERAATGRPVPPEGALDAIAPPLRERVRERTAALRDATRPEATALYEKMMRALKVFRERGGHLVVGTDPTGGGDVVPGYANQRAVQLLIEAGFSTAQAIRIATLDGARYLEVDAEVGTVEPGRRADLILMEGDLRADVDALRRMTLVFKDGLGYDSAALLGSVRGTVGIR